MFLRKATLVASIGVLLMSACAEDESTSGISTARSEMQPLVDAACDWMFGCCSADELVYQVGDFTVDADDCSERLLDAIATGTPLDIQQGDLSSDPAEGLLVLALSINEGRVSVNDGAVNDCADATTNQACNSPVEVSSVGRCTPSATDPNANPCDPNEMFSGRQEVGEQCDGPWECKDGLRCVDFGIAGVCALRARDGENCFSDAECAEGLVCDWADGTCTAGALSGETCGFSDPANPLPGTENIRCAAGLNCDPVTSVCVGGFCAPGSPCGDVFGDSDCPETYFCVGNFATQATCQRPGAEFAPCSKGDDCQSTYCDPFEEVCASLLAAGEACFENTECESGFCSGGLCNPSFGAGQPCPSQDSAECQGGFCDTADPANPVCTAYSPEGGLCPIGFECDPDAGLLCVDGVCLLPPFANGTSCTNSAQCESLSCFQDVCESGAVIGATCRIDDPAVQPCILGSFCEAPAGTQDGVCAELRRSGSACENSDQCWGECVVRFGRQMCDATPAFLLDEVWCDGAQ